MKSRDPGRSEIMKFPKTVVLRFWIRSRLTFSLAGGKIKLFARRKRTVKFDPNSEI